MTRADLRHGLTLGVYPTSRGFGWIAFEGPFAPYDWGTADVRRAKNLTCLSRLERLLDRLQPETLVLEQVAGSARRSNRIRTLTRAMMALAADRGVEVAVYARMQVQECFAAVGARTRHEIADAVARHVDAFRHKLPKQRRAWEGEDRRMALFSAAALVLTHYHFGASAVFEGLQDAA